MNYYSSVILQRELSRSLPSHASRSGGPGDISGLVVQDEVVVLFHFEVMW